MTRITQYWKYMLTLYVFADNFRQNGAIYFKPPWKFIFMSYGWNKTWIGQNRFVFFAGARGQKVVVSQKTPNFRPKLEKKGPWRHKWRQNDVIGGQFCSSFNSGHVDTSNLFIRSLVIEISMILILWSIYRKNAMLRHILRHCDVISWSIFKIFF